MAALTPPRLDPLSDEVELDRGGVPRDRWKRALLYRRGSDELEPYTGASTLADALQDDFGLRIWERRMGTKGIGMSRELSAMAGSSKYSTGFGEPDKGSNREYGRLLDELWERALDLGKAHERRDWGSAFHQYSEDRDPLGEPPEAMELDLESFWEEMDRHRITIIDQEVFVACDLLTSAGTFDILASAPWRPKPFIIDKKTGRVSHPERDMVQLVPYAKGDPYHVDDDGRHIRETFVEKYGFEVDETFGITAQTSAQSGRTELIPHDLVEGLEAAYLAIKVREHRRKNKRTKRTPVLSVEDTVHDFLRWMIDDLKSRGEIDKIKLKEIFTEFKDVWSDELTQYGMKAWRTQATPQGGRHE